MVLCGLCGRHAHYGYIEKQPIRCKDHTTQGMFNTYEKRCMCSKAVACFALPNDEPQYCVKCKKDGMIYVRSRKCLCKRGQPRFGFEGSSAQCCKECQEEGMVDLYTPKCRCGEHRPSYGNLGGKPTCCLGCKDAGMVYLLIRRKCEKCLKISPTYGYEGQTAVRCAGCWEEGMVDLVNRHCECGRIPGFAFPGERPIHCVKCKKEGMIDVKSTKCHKCKKTQPTYGYEGGSYTHCLGCKEDGMIDLRNKHCGCGKIPSFGFPGEEPIYCLGCKKDGTIDFNYKCRKCTKIQPTYGYPGQGVTHCSGCRENGMIAPYTPKCVKCNGPKPSYGYPGQRPTHCACCKNADMDDLINKKCISGLCGGNRASSNPQYKGHCRMCFVHLFPNEPISRNYKSKEKEVTKHVGSAFEGHNLFFDKIIDNGCSKRRPDIFLDLLTHVIICEIDENEHKNYDTMCEHKRVMQISQDLAHRPVVFIRFNPDSYKEAGKCIPSPWKHTIRGLEVSREHESQWKYRINTLIERIKYWIHTIPDKTITDEYLFFSETSDNDEDDCKSDLASIPDILVEKPTLRIPKLIVPIKSAEIQASNSSDSSSSSSSSNSSNTSSGSSSFSASSYSSLIIRTPVTKTTL